eukprot:GFKZ01015883.1.p1 GENE.GFKZ01015883.1~~GFKZ01015883.1.p1  ORF type:complete len:500 (+),score=93.49 GFKZ01015883.1:80-1501(+)
MPTGRTRTPSSRRRSRPARHDHEDSQDEQLDGGDPEHYFDHPKPHPDKPALGKRKRHTVESKPAVRDSEPFIFFQRLLRDLISRPVCQDFLRPVMDMWTPDQIPDYLERVRCPMDLGTVKEKLRGDRYVLREGRKYAFDHDACANDIRLIFENCMLYNDPESGLHATAEDLLNSVNTQIAAWHAHWRREDDNTAKRVKKENERRKRRKHAEDNAASTALALEKVKKQAEEAERNRRAEMQRNEKEMHALQQRMEREKQLAVANAVQEMLKKQQVERGRDERDGGSNAELTPAAQRGREGGRESRMVNTSSVSSDEQEAGTGEVTFAFVSTVGMEKKRGRKSAVVMELEAKHEELMKQRKAMVDVNVELGKMRQVEMTYEEKRALCEEVSGLDFVRMKAVADIISHGMNRPDILNEVEVDLDVNSIDNKVLREIQYFLKSPAAMTAKDALRNIEAQVAEIESRLVSIRYQKIGG